MLRALECRRRTYLVVWILGKSISKNSPNNQFHHPFCSKTWSKSVQIQSNQVPQTSLVLLDLNELQLLSPERLPGSGNKANWGRRTLSPSNGRSQLGHHHRHYHPHASVEQPVAELSLSNQLMSFGDSHQHKGCSHWSLERRVKVEVKYYQQLAFLQLNVLSASRHRQLARADQSWRRRRLDWWGAEQKKLKDV